MPALTVRKEFKLRRLRSGPLVLRSMAVDSELNILSQAKDVASKLRCNLFT